MLSEEYGQRNSGVPDLVCVKTPSFSLSCFVASSRLTRVSLRSVGFLSASGTTRNEPFDGLKSKDLEIRSRRRKKSGST